jgi:hypothetical protein
MIQSACQRAIQKFCLWTQDCFPCLSYFYAELSEDQLNKNIDENGDVRVHFEAPFPNDFVKEINEAWVGY